MTVTDYTTKIKEICDASGSFNVTVDEDEIQRYKPIRTTIGTREKTL